MSDECIICVQKMSSKDKKRGKRREVVCASYINKDGTEHDVTKKLREEIG